MFCKYCGRELKDGENCTCPESVAESQETANQSQYQSEPQVQVVQEKKVQEALEKALNLLKSFFKRPADTMEEAYGQDSVTAQLFVGILYPAAVFLFILIFILRVGSLLNVSFGTAFGPALGLAVLAAAMKAVHIAACYMTSDKSKSFQAVAGIYCIAAVPETACYLLLAIISLLGASALSIVLVLLLVALLAGAVSGFTANQIVFAGNRNKGYWLNLVVTLVVVAVTLMIMKTVFVNMIANLVYSSMYSLF